MDVCLITYRNTADRILPALRHQDQLWLRDNTFDNIGFARGANELARKGDQHLILFVNPDGDPEIGCFDRLEAVFNDPGIVAAEAVLDERWDEGWSAERYTWLSGTCLAVRRDAFEKVGGFDERLFMYSGDVDLSWRLAELGRLVHCAEAVFRHDRRRRGWRSLYRRERSALAVLSWYGRDRPLQVLGDGMKNIGRGELMIGTARVLAFASHVVKPIR